MSSGKNPEDLTPKERAALDKLDSHKSPPRSLEDRILSELKSQGLITPDRRFSQGNWRLTIPRLSIATLILVIVWGSGFLAGQSSQKDLASPPQSMYALLIHNDANFKGDPRDQAIAYGNWMIGLRDSGHFATGQELQDDGQILKMTDNKVDATSFSEDDIYGQIGGFFLIGAENDAEAIKVASGCPHLQYDGTIEIRKIILR